MKHYIKLEGLIHKPEGWTEDQHSEFTDKLIELAEGFGIDIQISVSTKLVDESEVEND